MGLSWKRGLAAVTSVTAVALLLAGCGTNTTSSGKSADTTANSASETASNSDQKPVEGGSITLDSTQAVPDLDPAVAYDMRSTHRFINHLSHMIRILTKSFRN